MAKQEVKEKHKSLGLVLVSVIFIFAVVLNMKNIQYLLIGAQGQNANIQIDAKSKMGKIPGSWRSVAQGGEAKDYSYGPVVNNIRELGIEYIRIDHVYDFYEIVSRAGDGQLQFNFTKLDKVISDIQAGGATPFIALSYMPPVISRGDIVDLPRQWSEWQLTIRKTIEHISGSTGLNIPNVYYEVWNEPDLFGKWKTYGEKNYLDLYYYAAKGAEQATSTQPYKFGGPATTAIYDNWVTRFIEFTTRNNLRVDFYSWHRYSTSVERFNEDLMKMGEIMQKYPDKSNQIEYIISEWGPDSNNNAVYDGKMAGAHFVAVSTQISPYIKRLISFELQDGKDPEGKKLWGRWGMMTHQDFGSQPKPRYHAMKLINQMNGEILGLLGNGSWVKAMATKTSEGNYQLILTNYDPDNRHVESVPVKFRNIEPGNYILTQEFLGQTPSRLRLSTGENGQLVFTTNLQSNDVALLTLTRSAIQ